MCDKSARHPPPPSSELAGDEILLAILMIPSREKKENEKCFVLCCPQTNFFGFVCTKLRRRGEGGGKSADDDKVYENIRENQFRSEVNQSIKRNLIKQSETMEGKKELKGRKVHKRHNKSLLALVQLKLRPWPTKHLIH